MPAVDQSAVARVVGIETIFKDLRGSAAFLLPQRIAVIGQGASTATYATTKRTITSAVEAGTVYGFGSPIHLAAQQLLPANGDGVGLVPVTVYPLEDDVAGVAAAGDITPAGAVTSQQSLIVRINNIDSQPFVATVGDTVAALVTKITAAINANVDMPVIATDSVTQVDLAAKWDGASGNDLTVSVIGEDSGATFAITQPTGGLNNPDIQAALDLFGDVWETLVLNCLETADTTALDALSTTNEGRWLPTVRRPFVAFAGSNETTVATAITIPDARKTDRTNCQLVEPGGSDLPLVIAARQLARIAVIANNNPPQDYGSQKATGLVPGADGDQWNYAERDQAVKGGSSTIEVKDGVVNLSDTVTFYHPDGDPTPAYRFVVDVIKLQNILFNLDLIFATEAWDGAPLIPDNQPTTNPTAKQPKMARAEIASMVDALGLAAILSDPETAKRTITAGINGANPKRLDVALTVQLSGNSNIISIDFNFGFFFG